MTFSVTAPTEIYSFVGWLTPGEERGGGGGGVTSQIFDCDSLIYKFQFTVPVRLKPPKPGPFL